MYNVCRACHQAYVGEVDPPSLQVPDNMANEASAGE